MINNYLVMHLLVALVWLFLSGNTTSGNFFIALLGTYGLLVLFRRAIGCEDYVQRVRAFVLFIFRFMHEVIRANLHIMHVALTREGGKIPGDFVHYNIADMTDLEVLLLSYCISLSPGTMVADRSDDNTILVLHAFACGSPDEVRALIDRTLRDNILAFTR